MKCPNSMLLRQTKEASFETSFFYSAESGTRTRTGLHPLDPEPSASANSATSANGSQKFKL